MKLEYNKFKELSNSKNKETIIIIGGVTVKISSPRNESIAIIIKVMVENTSTDLFYNFTPCFDDMTHVSGGWAYDGLSVSSRLSMENVAHYLNVLSALLSRLDDNCYSFGSIVEMVKQVKQQLLN